MTTRLLPVGEWVKVANTDLGRAMAQGVDPRDLTIVVVEDGDRIVACWGVLRVTHLEGVWIDPAYRKRVSVVRELLGATLNVARQWGRWAMTGAQTDDVRRLVTKHLGGVKLPIDAYVIPLGD